MARFIWKAQGTSGEIKPVKGTIRIAVLNDLHFPYEDPDAMILTSKILEDFHPDVLILNGDIVDFYGISKYPKPPTRAAMFADELRSARHRLKQMHAWFPQAKWIYLEGNHEQRCSMFLYRRAKELFGLEELQVQNLLKCDELGITYLAHVWEPALRSDYVSPQVQIGKLFVLHGNTIKCWGNTINVARTVFLKTLKPMLIGHWHRVQTYFQTDYEGSTSGCWVNGCLARPRPHYDAGRIWGQGIALLFAEGAYFEVELLNYFQKRGYLITTWRGNQYRVKLGHVGWE